MNGTECDYVHNDPLKQLSYDSSTRAKFLGEEADVNYRAALEISRTGELSLRIPEELPPVIAKPRPLPRGVPSDVSVRYDKLLKVILVRDDKFSVTIVYCCLFQPQQRTDYFHCRSFGVACYLFYCDVFYSVHITIRFTKIWVLEATDIEGIWMMFNCCSKKVGARKTETSAEYWR